VVGLGDGGQDPRFHFPSIFFDTEPDADLFISAVRRLMDMAEITLRPLPGGGEAKIRTADDVFGKMRPAWACDAFDVWSLAEYIDVADSMLYQHTWRKLR
jgi:hypothetical protein